MTTTFRHLFALLGVFILLLPMPAWAGRQCYLPAELEAEQLLRLHSQLMVITYACKQGSRAQNLLTYYNSFTVNNIAALKKAEQTLIDFYKTRFSDDGIAHLDDLRTKLGNEFSREAAEDSAPLYCREYRDRVISFYYNTPVQVANEARHMALTQKSYTALCKMADNSKTARMDKKTP